MDSFKCNHCGFKHRRSTVAAGNSATKNERITCPKCQTVAVRRKRQVRGSYAASNRATSGGRSACQKLTPEHREELHTVFNSYDFDGSGEVDLGEFRSMWNVLGGNPTAAEIQERLETCCDGRYLGSGVLDFDAFCELIWPSLLDQNRSAVEQVMAENITKALQSLDKNKDGVIGKVELERMLTKGGSDSVSKAEVNEILQLFKENGIKKMEPHTLALFLMEH